jgi:hypothetical protein
VSLNRVKVNKSSTQIWVDADACPVPVKEMLFRAAVRTGVQVTLVANHAMRIPPASNVNFLQVSNGFDLADNKIVELVCAGDLVVTADIPLAAEVIEKNGQVITPRGEPFSVENIKARLTMRDFMDTLRASGVHSGGPAVFSAKDRQRFANQLDRYLASNS